MATLMEKDVLIEKIANLINDLMLHHKEAIEDIAWLIASREWLLFSSHTSIAFHAWIQLLDSVKAKFDVGVVTPMSQHDALQKACDLTWQRLSKYAQSVDEPMGIVLGGQPGAGKSRVAQTLIGMMPKPIYINADEFRSLHPEYLALQAKYGADAPKYTGEFSGQVAENILMRAIDARISVIIEGTFRNPATPIKTLQRFKSHGYQTQATIVTTHQDLSWSSTLERGHVAEAIGEIPRFVDRALYQRVVNSLPQNADLVFASGFADRFVVLSRTRVCFDSKVDAGTPGAYIAEALMRDESQSS